MREIIEAAIVHQAKKLLRRDDAKRWMTSEHRERFEKRTGRIAGVGTHRVPTTWSVHPHFNPKYCIKHSKFIARVLWQKISARTYQPKPAVLFRIPKDAGGFREIMVFSVPDAAIANIFHRKLTKKNLNAFSANSYSYRPDRNLFDAVLQLSSALAGDRIYVVQYDFRKYFDSISHSYIRKLLDGKFFLTTKLERAVIDAFLVHQYASPIDYVAGNFSPRTVGVPQGCSLSLFLSNIAGHELDKSLEMKNGQFVRFADDVVVATYAYDDALNVVSAFSRHQIRSGVSINFDKSPGIQLLESGIADLDRSYFMSSGEGSDIECITHFDYLGHRFIRKKQAATSQITLSEKAIRRIKKKISSIIYVHLLLNPRARSLFSPMRVGAGYYDWDLVTCLNEIRRYIYGSLREREIASFINDDVKLRRVKGLMAFYPLISDPSPLMSLDGWLLNVLRRALVQRSRSLAALGQPYIAPTPRQILEGNWYQYATVTNESRCPSFVRGWRAARKYYFKYGLGEIQAPRYYSALATY